MTKVSRQGWSVSVRRAKPGAGMTSVGATLRSSDGAVLLSVGGGPSVVLDAAAGAQLLADVREALTAGEQLVDGDGEAPNPAVVTVTVPAPSADEAGEVMVHATRDGRVVLQVVPPGPLAMPLRQAAGLIEALRSVGRDVARRAATGREDGR